MSADTSTCPAKCARASLEHESSHLPSSPPAPSLADLKHHPEFWFNDGNIVLIAQHTGFRIFRGLLAAQSTIFTDMFASSSSNAGESLDGCPVVHLTDSVIDLTHLLHILLQTSPMCYPTTSHDISHSFNEVFAVVRLTHKYLIQSVEDQVILALQEFPFTSNFSIHASPPKCQVIVQGAQYIGAVNLAHLTDSPLMLPLALLECCRLRSKVLDGWTQEDGTTEYLCMADLKRCMDARIALNQEQFLLFSRMFNTVPLVKCATRGICTTQVTNILRAIVSKEEMVKKPILFDWAPSIRATGGLCEGCRQVLLDRNQAECQRMWDSLPRVFGITVEGWVQTDSAGTAGPRKS